METMDRLFAPWRVEYVTHVDDCGGCFLCAARDTGDDEKSLVLWRGKRSFALLNKYPYSGGHLLIAPKEHGGDFKAIAAETLTEIMQAAQAAAGILEREMKIHGANVGLNLGRAAGAGVADHVHLHVVPRWSGDTNFMPVLGEARVISEGLAETWKRLRPAFDKLSK
jgi:ATP adenylyltransferase